MSGARPAEAVYELLTNDDDGRVCRDIPESACRQQPGNFLKHVLSLGATKTGDGLVDPKLILAWLLGSLGAAPWLAGLLVPVREAGSLLPQLVIAAGIRARSRRKWVWAAGSAVQGLAAAGMAAAALSLTGDAAGWAIVALLALFALARSACSVSYKDVLGKTVSKSTRGTATGAAGTVAAALVLGYGVLLSTGALARSVEVLSAGLLVAGGLWVLAAALFATLAEAPGATEGGGSAWRVARQQAALLRQDGQLVRFIAVRALLTATALAPPYLLTLAGPGAGRGLGELGLFVTASSLASVASTYLWGRWADVSSRRVLMAAAGLGALALAAAPAVTIWAPHGWVTGWAGRALMPALLFVLMIAYQGVRLGRSTHLVDMADTDSRAAYTALSNTCIGLVLVGGGAFGLLAQAAGVGAVLTAFAAMCLAAAWLARGLEEVQAD